MSQYYLVHHGILGQKWGVRKGPPYPLDASSHTSSEKKEGNKGWTEEAKKESKDDSSTGKDKEKFHLTDKQKKTLKIGAVAVGTALVAYGGYKIYKNGKTDFVKNTFGDILPSIEKTCEESGITIRNIITSAENDCINMANPNYDPYNHSTSNNCVSSALAFCCERLGMNVTAKPLPVDRFDHGYSNEELRSAIKGILPEKIDFGNVKTASDAKNHLTNQILEVCDDGHNVGIFSIRRGIVGHEMAWEKEAGSSIVRFFDPAKRSTDTSMYFDLLSKENTLEVYSTRIDDCIIDGNKLLELFVDKI